MIEKTLLLILAAGIKDNFQTGVNKLLIHKSLQISQQKKRLKNMQNCNCFACKIGKQKGSQKQQQGYNDNDHHQSDPQYYLNEEDKEQFQSSSSFSEIEIDDENGLIAPIQLSPHQQPEGDQQEPTKPQEKVKKIKKSSLKKKKNTKKEFEKIDDKYDDHFNEVFFLKSLCRLRKQKVESLELLISMTGDFLEKEESNPDIKFYFNIDGSSAILFSLFCDKAILHKNINMRDRFDSLFFHNESCQILLITHAKFDINKYDQNQQQYSDHILPLNVFVSTKYETQKKVLSDIGWHRKKVVLSGSFISNSRLKSDMSTLFTCLDNDLEFIDSFSSYQYFVYYTQSKDSNILEGLIIGPQNTPYEGIPYTMTITIPTDYPNSPPKIVFNQQILHPNISDEGKICLDILQNNWSSVLTLEDILISIVSLLHEKNLDDVYNHFAKKLYTEDPETLKKFVRKQAVLSECQNLKIDYTDLQRLSKLQQVSSYDIHKDFNYCDENDNDSIDYDYDGKMDEEEDTLE